jgi:NAD(P)-dependent dehydrogenase (short-subunit alcohol dehydrogenase family)
MPVSFALDGRHALVTGGGRGIGAGIARALKDHGAMVTVLGRTAATLEAAIARGDADHMVTADVTDEASLAEAIRRAEALAPLGIVVANAGQAEAAPLRKATRADFDRLISVDLSSVFDTARLTIPTMAARGTGRFVAIASIAGLIGMPNVSAYVAAKHGVVGLVRALAREYATSGVTVNAVCPGYVDTDLVQENAVRVAARTGRPLEEIKAEFVKTSPIRRFVTVDEVAAAVVWLAGAQAGAVTGAAIPIAGGEVN